MGLSVFDEHTPWWRTFVVPAGDAPGDFGFTESELQPLRIDQILIATDNTDPVEVALEFSQDNGSYIEIAHIAVPAGAGVIIGIPPVDLLDPVAGVLVDCVVPTTGGMRFAVIGSLAAGTSLFVFAKGGFI